MIPEIIIRLAAIPWTEKPSSLVNNQCSDIFTWNIIRINSAYGNNKKKQDFMSPQLFQLWISLCSCYQEFEYRTFDSSFSIVSSTSF